MKGIYRFFFKQCTWKVYSIQIYDVEYKNENQNKYNNST